MIYIRVVNHSTTMVQSRLLTAKTRVAPLKTQSIPRLELCGAMLLAQTLRSVQFLHDTLKIKTVKLFTDSTTVLSWIRTPPHKIECFVANRVVKINELTKEYAWS